MEFKTICLLSLIIVVSIVLAAHKERSNPRRSLTGRKKIVKKTNVSKQPQVQLENGPTVIGTINKTVDENKVYYAFRGIPFAEPPIGNRRFKPPVPLSKNTTQTTIYATKDAPSCVQSELLPSSVMGSEDCLYVNVYKPYNSSQNGTLFPVMVWIFGGAFVVGSGSYESYGPDYFLDEGNVMVVTFNYRVGIFGFLSTEDDASPGNYGLKDQLLALKWIKANIKSFGGNPEEITIFGESAGSVSVSYLSQTPLSKGLFRGAIMESGTTLNLWGLTRNPRSTAVITAQLLHVDTTTSQSMVDGLRKTKYKELQAAQQLAFYIKLLLGDPLDGLPYGPTIEPSNPDAIVIGNSHENLQNGYFHNIPYVIGLNSMESIPFVNVLNLIRWYLIKFDLGPTALVPASMNIDNALVKDKVNAEIKLHYFGLTPVTLSEDKLIKFTSSDEFSRPILEATRLYSQTAPVYFYKFSYQGSLAEKNKTQLGVGHAAEILYLYRTDFGYYATQSDILTRRKLIKLWTNFAVTGNPTPGNDSLLENVNWPLASSDGKDNLVYLNINKTLNVSTNPNWNDYMFWRKLFNEYGNPPYSTY